MIDQNRSQNVEGATKIYSYVSHYVA